MKVSRASLATTLVLAAVIGCSNSSPDASKGESSAHAVSPADSGPQAALDALDQRAPVPLLPMMANHQKANMRDHLVAVREIVSGLQNEDFAAVEKSASKIGYSEQMGQMCSHMGAGAPGFTDQALVFHRTADGIAEAARTHDSRAVLAALDATLATCTGCHASYKQHVVAELDGAPSHVQ